MTFDHEPDQDDLDEIVSAVVDGEASRSEQDRVAADPDLVDRREQFLSVAAQVQAVTPVDDAAKEATLAAVLAAAGATRSAQVPPTDHRADHTPVVDLAPRRSARSKRWLPAVAAIVIALLAVPALLIAMNRDSGLNDLASSSSDSAEPAIDATAGAPASTTTTNAGAAPTQESAGGFDPATTDADLGVVDSPEDLTSSVRTQLSAAMVDAGDAPATTTTSFSTRPSTSSSTTMATHQAPQGYNCTAPIRALVSGLGDLVLTASATYQGAPVQVYGFDDPSSDATIVVAADPVTCTIVEQTTA